MGASANIKIHKSIGRLHTEGLSSTRQAELAVNLNSGDVPGDAEALLGFLSSYLLDSARVLKSGETLAYGYWLLKFIDAGDGVLIAHEYNAEATEFIAGASFAMGCWREQHLLCGRCSATFSPPRPDRLTVVDPAVFDGHPVQGVRYPSPDTMSGWWITTDKFNGDTKTLKHEHTYHLTAHRPDLAKFLALPVGFRFDLTSVEDVWFDSNVAKS